MALQPSGSDQFDQYSFDKPTTYKEASKTLMGWLKEVQGRKEFEKAWDAIQNDLLRQDTLKTIKHEILATLNNASSIPELNLESFNMDGNKEITQGELKMWFRALDMYVIRTIKKVATPESFELEKKTLASTAESVAEQKKENLATFTKFAKGYTDLYHDAYSGIRGRTDLEDDDDIAGLNQEQLANQYGTTSALRYAMNDMRDWEFFGNEEAERQLEGRFINAVAEKIRQLGVVLQLPGAEESPDYKRLKRYYDAEVKAMADIAGGIGRVEDNRYRNAELANEFTLRHLQPLRLEECFDWVEYRMDEIDDGLFDAESSELQAMHAALANAGRTVLMQKLQAERQAALQSGDPKRIEHVVNLGIEMAELFTARVGRFEMDSRLTDIDWSIDVLEEVLDFKLIAAQFLEQEFKEKNPLLKEVTDGKRKAAEKTFSVFLLDEYKEDSPELHAMATEAMATLSQDPTGTDVATMSSQIVLIENAKYLQLVLDDPEGEHEQPDVQATANRIEKALGEFYPKATKKLRTFLDEKSGNSAESALQALKGAIPGLKLGGAKKKAFELLWDIEGWGGAWYNTNWSDKTTKEVIDWAKVIGQVAVGVAAFAVSGPLGAAAIMTAYNALTEQRGFDSTKDGLIIYGGEFAKNYAGALIGGQLANRVATHAVGAVANPTAARIIAEGAMRFTVETAIDLPAGFMMDIGHLALTEKVGLGMAFDQFTKSMADPKAWGTMAFMTVLGARNGILDTTARLNLDANMNAMGTSGAELAPHLAKLGYSPADLVAGNIPRDVMNTLPQGAVNTFVTAAKRVDRGLKVAAQQESTPPESAPEGQGAASQAVFAEHQGKMDGSLTLEEHTQNMQALGEAGQTKQAKENGEPNPWNDQNIANSYKMETGDFDAATARFEQEFGLSRADAEALTAIVARAHFDINYANLDENSAGFAITLAKVNLAKRAYILQQAKAKGIELNQDQATQILSEGWAGFFRPKNKNPKLKEVESLFQKGGQFDFTKAEGKVFTFADGKTTMTFKHQVGTMTSSGYGNVIVNGKPLVGRDGKTIIFQAEADQSGGTVTFKGEPPNADYEVIFGSKTVEYTTSAPGKNPITVLIRPDGTHIESRRLTKTELGRLTEKPIYLAEIPESGGVEYIVTTHPDGSQTIRYEDQLPTRVLHERRIFTRNGQRWNPMRSRPDSEHSVSPSIWGQRDVTVALNKENNTTVRIQNEAPRPQDSPETAVITLNLNGRQVVVSQENGWSYDADTKSWKKSAPNKKGEVTMTIDRNGHINMSFTLRNGGERSALRAANYNSASRQNPNRIHAALDELEMGTSANPIRRRVESARQRFRRSPGEKTSLEAWQRDRADILVSEAHNVTAKIRRGGKRVRLNMNGLKLEIKTPPWAKNEDAQTVTYKSPESPDPNVPTLEVQIDSNGEMILMAKTEKSEAFYDSTLDDGPTRITSLVPHVNNFNNAQPGLVARTRTYVQENMPSRSAKPEAEAAAPKPDAEPLTMEAWKKGEGEITISEEGNVTAQLRNGGDEVTIDVDGTKLEIVCPPWDKNEAADGKMVTYTTPTTDAVPVPEFSVSVRDGELHITTNTDEGGLQMASIAEDGGHPFGPSNKETSERMARQIEEYNRAQPAEPEPRPAARWGEPVEPVIIREGPSKETTAAQEQLRGLQQQAEAAQGRLEEMRAKLEADQAAFVRDEIETEVDNAYGDARRDHGELEIMHNGRIITVNFDYSGGWGFAIGNTGGRVSLNPDQVRQGLVDNPNFAAEAKAKAEAKFMESPAGKKAQEDVQRVMDEQQQAIEEQTAAIEANQAALREREGQLRDQLRTETDPDVRAKLEAELAEVEANIVRTSRIRDGLAKAGQRMRDIREGWRNMSRLDKITISIVIVSLTALAELIRRIVGLLQERKEERMRREVREKNKANLGRLFAQVESAEEMNALVLESPINASFSSYPVKISTPQAGVIELTVEFPPENKPMKIEFTNFLDGAYLGSKYIYAKNEELQMTLVPDTNIVDIRHSGNTDVYTLFSGSTNIRHHTPHESWRDLPEEEEQTILDSLFKPFFNGYEAASDVSAEAEADGQPEYTDWSDDEATAPAGEENAARAAEVAETFDRTQWESLWAKDVESAHYQAEGFSIFYGYDALTLNVGGASFEFDPLYGLTVVKSDDMFSSLKGEGNDVFVELKIKQDPAQVMLILRGRMMTINAESGAVNTYNGATVESMEKIFLEITGQGEEEATAPAVTVPETTTTETPDSGGNASAQASQESQSGADAGEEPPVPPTPANTTPQTAPSSPSTTPASGDVLIPESVINLGANRGVALVRNQITAEAQAIPGLSFSSAAEVEKKGLTRQDTITILTHLEESAPASNPGGDWFYNPDTGESFPASNSSLYVLALQAAMREADDFNGAIDGLYGRQTRNFIRDTYGLQAPNNTLMQQLRTGLAT